MVVSENAHAHSPVHCASRPKMSHQFCNLPCTRAGATVALIELRGKPTVVRSPYHRWLPSELNENETVRLKVSVCVKTPKWLDRQRSQARSPQIVTDATAMLRSCKPSHA